MKNLIFMFFLVFTAKNQVLANLDIFFNAIQKQKPDCAFISLEEALQKGEDIHQEENSFVYLTAKDLDITYPLLAELNAQKNAALFIQDHELEANQQNLNAFLEHFPETQIVLNVTDGCRVRHGTLDLKKSQAEKIRFLTIVNQDQSVKKICNNFLISCSNLERIDLTFLPHLTSIGNDFLWHCQKLQEIVLPPASIKSIDDGFLLGCKSLKKLDLSPLTNVTSIGNKFLYNWENLEELDLSPLTNVTSIGNNFLSACKSLKELDLSPLMNVTSIGDYFLSFCENLEELNLNALMNVTSIGNDFLSHCESLKELDLRPLTNLTSIGNNFLSGCKGLTNLDLNALTNLTSIGNNFLSGCKSLKELDLSPLINVTSIGNYFLFYCESLKELDLRPLINASVAQNFLSGLPDLHSLHYPDHLKEKVSTALRFSVSRHPENVFRRFIEENQEGDDFQRFIHEVWGSLEIKQKEDILELLVHKYGEEHPQIQKFLFSSEAADLPSVMVHKDLLNKIKEEVVLHPSLLQITSKVNDVTHNLHFQLGQICFSYQAINETPLASLDDVDAILNGNLSEVAQNVRNDLEFQSFFLLPLSPEKRMMQAIVKKYQQLPKEEARNQMVGFMERLRFCQQGKNEEVQTQYALESEPIPMAVLQDITNMIARLNADEQRVLFEMCSLNHPFGLCLREAKDTRSKLLRALFGKYKEDQETSVYFLRQLQDQNHFDQNLHFLLKAHQIVLPASIYQDDLSFEALEGLIATLKGQDLEGRMTLAEAQAKMTIFINSEVFKTVLADWNSDTGRGLRKLMEAYVRNKWPMGLLNFVEMYNSSNDLSRSVEVTMQNTNLDRDVIACAQNLKELILEQFQRLKVLGVNQVAALLLGDDVLAKPHQLGYIRNLLGEKIGLRSEGNLPDCDLFLKKEPTDKGLQEVLDLFHEKITPNTLIDHLIQMMVERKLSIIDSTGKNIIWEMIRLSAKKALRALGIDMDDPQNEGLLHEEGCPTPLAMALTLEQLGLLERVQPE